MRKNAFTLAEGATHVGIFHNTHRVAFTLAEVLITLGIIGVVATLTLPNVMSNYAKKSQVTQLQRTVNAISSAAANYMLENKVDSLAESNFINDLDSFFRNYLGCTSAQTDKSKVFSSTNYKGLDGSANDIALALGTQSTCGKLTTGAIVCINTGFIPIDGYYVSTDVNGNAGPNVVGRDFFGFRLTNKGRIKSGISTNQLGYEADGVTPILEEYIDLRCKEGSNSEYTGCFNKIMDEGWEMNY